MSGRVGWLVQAGLGLVFAALVQLLVPGGVFILLAVVLFLVVRGVISRSGRQSGTDPDEGGRADAGAHWSGPARPSVDPRSDVADRLSRLAGELVMPGGRSNEEVLREAARVYAQLPPEVRAELEKGAPGKEGLHVEISGPAGPAIARLMGLPADVVVPDRPAGPPAPAPTPSPGQAGD